MNSEEINSFGLVTPFCDNDPDNKVHGAYKGPNWDRQDPGGPNVGPMNFAILGCGLHYVNRYTYLPVEAHPYELQYWRSNKTFHLPETP